MHKIGPAQIRFTAIQRVLPPPPYYMTSLFLDLFSDSRPTTLRVAPAPFSRAEGFKDTIMAFNIHALRMFVNRRLGWGGGVRQLLGSTSSLGRL